MISHRRGSDGVLFLVGKVGLEPTRPFGHQDLNLARLPIPPHAQKL